MTDQELVDAFEAGTLPAAAFRHREHVRVTWAYLVRYGRADAERRLMEGLEAFALRAGRPGKFDATLTGAWVAAIDAGRLANPDVRTFDELAARRPDLLDTRSVRASREASG
jgi:hypothetical protein